MHSPNKLEIIWNHITWFFRNAYWAVRGRRPIITDSFKAWKHKMFQSMEEEARNECPSSQPLIFAPHEHLQKLP